MIKKMLTIGSAKNLKSGLTKAGKPWTLYEVSCVDEEGEVEKFTSFNSHKEMIGMMTPIMLEKEINGKFTNWKESNKQSEAKAGQAKFEENVYEAFRVINGKLDKLLMIKNSIDD